MLQKCVDIAEQLGGDSHLAVEGSRLLNLPPESYAIDLRRLFDSLRSEHSSIVLVYSAAEHRLLFVNNKIRGLLGWSPEKFVKEFAHILQKGSGDWKSAVAVLQKIRKYEVNKGQQIRLLMKAKSGEDLLVRCYLGLVREGIFGNLIVGVLYPA